MFLFQLLATPATNGEQTQIHHLLVHWLQKKTFQFNDSTIVQILTMRNLELYQHVYDHH
jgi:hypothetical protein